MGKQFAVVGLGAMGMGIAKSLLTSGFSVCGIDLRDEALEAFSALGGQTAKSFGDVADTIDCVFVVVVNSAQLESVLFGDDCAINKMPAGAVVVSNTTVAPSVAQDMATRVNEAGLDFIDAPISGGALKAAQGELTVMASGSEAAFAKVDGGFNAISAKLYVLGDAPGQGSAMKVVNQLLAGVHIAAAAEAVAFGSRMGLDQKAVYEVITNAAGNSWMFENRVPHILEDDFTPLSAVDIFVKDLGLVLDSARDVKFPATMAANAHQKFIDASAQGFGRLDDSAVIKVYPSEPYNKD
ncbi:MAG: NAD-binding protein [Magnetovibrio sp.]|nr:NAD-binding protein [Magnetovibrio sp.]